MKKKVIVIVTFFILYFGVFSRSAFAQTVQPPTDRIDTLSYVILNGKLREVAIRDNTVFWRDSTDTTEKNLPFSWSSKLLSDVWTSSVSPADHPLPTGGITDHKYQQFYGCGNFGNWITELVIKGGELWYRRSSDINGTDLGNKVFTYQTLAQTWGTSGPPTDSIDAISYDIYDGSPRELVIKGGNVWFRNIDCGSSQLGSWSTQSLTKSWTSPYPSNYSPSSPQTPPPQNGGIDVYTTDYTASDNSMEIVIQGASVWSRRSRSTNNHQLTDVWRKSTLNDLFRRNSIALTNSDIASNFINSFMSIYGNTDFSLVMNSASSNNLRALLAQALAYAVRYRLNNNSTPDDLQKAKYFINYSVNHFPLGGTTGNTFEDALNGEAMRGLLLSSWILWDTFSTQEKSSIQTIAREESDYWVSKLTEAQNGGPFISEITGYQDDTKAETNGTIAEGLAFAATMFPDNPAASSWEQTGRCFAFHTITTSQQAAQSRGDTSTKCGITTQTVYDDFTLDNHNYHPSVLYTLAAIAPLDQAGLGYYLSGFTIPSEFKHNTAPLWEKYLTYFHPGDYTIFPQYYRGQDWGDIDIWLAMTDFNYIDKIDNSSSLGGSERDRIAWDIVHYFYTIKGGVLRMPTNPVSQMPVDGSVPSNWFLNTLTHAKGSAEIIIYSNPQLFFCRGNVDILGKSTHLCNPSIPVKPFPSPTPTATATPKPGDLNGDGHVDIYDYNLLVTNFGHPYTIFDYNILVANFGK